MRDPKRALTQGSRGRKARVGISSQHRQKRLRPWRRGTWHARPRKRSLGQARGSPERLTGMRETRPKLSVVTICGNEGARIRQTLDSVLKQIFRDWELVLIDGASTDGTQELIEEYRDKLAYFESEPDQGI